MTKKTKPTKYPRYKFRRAILNTIGKGIFKLLADVKIEGIENIPQTGPVILAGNHVENLEAAFSMFYPKRIVEPIGAGDIPFDKGLDTLVNLYGFIAIDRGTVDRAALREAQSVLEQGAALSIFPEGGTWRPGKMPAQIGVALLSERGKAPVVPIGYSGFNGAIKKALSFKRPTLTMRVGKPIPPLVLDPDGPSTKEQMQAYADEVMRHVHDLLDESELNITPQHEDYQLNIRRGIPNSTLVDLPQIEGGEAFVSFINMKVLLDTLKNSLKLPVAAFYPNQETYTLDGFIQAIDVTLDYLKKKANFFNYRMGYEMGDKMPKVLESLRKLALESKGLAQSLILEANIKQFYLNDEERQIHYNYQLLP